METRKNADEVSLGSLLPVFSARMDEQLGFLYWDSQRQESACDFPLFFPKVKGM